MAEPTTSTTVAITASAGLVSLLPFVNGDALFGAVIGAALLIRNKLSKGDEDTGANDVVIISGAF